MNANIQAVGSYFRRLREAKGLSVTQVAAALDTVERQIRIIENGERDTRGSMLVNMCHYLEGNIYQVAYLMMSADATPEEGRQLAEEWLDRDEQPYAMAAEERGEYQPH
jgi:transcriptional regulator with XRE-family HTH domain